MAILSAHRHHHATVASLALVLGGLPAAPDLPQNSDAESRALALRASFLLKLPAYLAPAGQPAPPPRLRIGVLGKDGTGEKARQMLHGKSFDGVDVEVLDVPLATVLDGKAALPCDLLYLAASVEPADLQKVLAATAARPLPLVSERPGFAKAGGGIQLFVEDKHLRLEANAEVLQRQGLKVSAQLLKLSRRGPEQ